MASIHPNEETWPTLRRPLEEGEKALARFLGEHLDDSWRVFLQVWLNGAEVDVAAWSPGHGLVLYEVKDWHAGRRLRIEDGALWADGYRVRDPVSQVDVHRRTALSPLSPLARTEAPRPVVAGVYLHRWSAAQADALLRTLRPPVDRRRGPGTHPIVGGDTLSQGRLNQVLGNVALPRSQPFSPEVDAAMHRLLGEADADAEQRIPLPLNRTQRQLATTRTRTGYRRITGPAGSGKTAILAARSAELASQGRRPLVVSFNHTLWHWIRDLAVRHSPDRRNSTVGRIRFCTFHDWCEQVCIEAGLGTEFGQVIRDADEYPLPEIKNVVAKALADGVAPPGEEQRPIGYDDLLVDEAQDLDAESWDLLRRSVLDERQPGERLIATDAEQNLYGHELAWATDATAGATAGFSGPPLRLSFSYRIPPTAIPALNDFRARMLPASDLPPLEAGASTTPGQLEFGCTLRWRQVEPWEFEQELLATALSAPDDMGLHPADVVVLVQQNAVGLRLVRSMRAAGVKLKHVFGERPDEKKHRRKSFWKGQSYLASTIHSFKGYEQRGVVLGLGSPTAPDDVESLVATYVGLTRVKAMSDGSASLVVVCADRRLSEFGERWFDTNKTA